MIKQIQRKDWDVRGGQITHTVNSMVTPSVVVSKVGLWLNLWLVRIRELSIAN